MLVTNKLQYHNQLRVLKSSVLGCQIRYVPHTHTHTATNLPIGPCVAKTFCLFFALHHSSARKVPTQRLFDIFFFLHSLDIDFNFDLKIVERAITLATLDVSQCFCNQVEEGNNMINCAHVVPKWLRLPLT